MVYSKLKSSKIRISDISISYFIKKATKNERQAIIFLHGFPFNKNMWRGQLENLDEYTTGYAVDIRGHGNTTSGHGFFSIDVFAADLIGFIKKLGLSKVVVCGISMGGYIALRALEMEPDLVDGLILCDTHSKADDNSAKQKRFNSINAILNHGRRPFAIGFTENVFAKDTLQKNPSAVELIKSSIRRNSLKSICSTQLALASRTDTTESAKLIKKPTLLIRGIEDKITPEATMLELHESIKDSEFVQIEYSGHLPNLENPTAFNEKMNQFLSVLKV